MLDSFTPDQLVPFNDVCITPSSPTATIIELLEVTPLKPLYDTTGSVVQTYPSELILITLVPWVDPDIIS